MEKLNQRNREDYIRTILNELNAQNIDQFRELFLELHPTDQMEIFMSLDEKDRHRVYEYTSPSELAEIFQALELEDQTRFVSELDQSFAVSMMNNMSSDDAADFLGQLPEVQSQQILNRMSKEDAQNVKSLLAYPEKTAGAIMTTELISISSKDTTSDVMAQLRKEGPKAETIYYLYVIDEAHKLVGVVSLRDLIVSDSDEIIENVMSTRVVSVAVNEDQEDVADMFRKYDFLAVPVVNKVGEFVGIITVDDVMDVIEEEATEDIGEISGVRGATDLNMTAFASARKRSPWIILLMFLGLITAGVIGEFEETLEAYVLLAAFIPMIMDSAGNTGTQSLAVVVRGLALGSIERSGIGRLLRRELFTGVMLGLICAIVISLIITIFPFIEGGFILGFIVGFSLFVALSVATFIGAIVPLIINKLKIDPAIASGPFITTINDIIGLFVYFTVATAMLQYL